MKLEYYKSKTGWRWRVRARNGKILCNGGQGYSRFRDMMQSIIRMKVYLREMTMVQVKR